MVGVDQSGSHPQSAQRKHISRAVYPPRVEQQGELQSGRMRAQPRINSDQQTERESTAGQYNRVDQGGVLTVISRANT